MMTETPALVVILGARPGTTADEALGDVPAGGSVKVYVPAARPTAEQQRFVERAMALSWQNGFTLTAELVLDGRALVGSLNGEPLRVLAGARERRRLGLAADR